MQKNEKKKELRYPTLSNEFYHILGDVYLILFGTELTNHQKKPNHFQLVLHLCHQGHMDTEMPCL